MVSRKAVGDAAERLIPIDARQRAVLPGVASDATDGRPGQAFSPSAAPFEHSRPKFAGCSRVAGDRSAAQSIRYRELRRTRRPQYGQVVRIAGAGASAFHAVRRAPTFAWEISAVCRLRHIARADDVNAPKRSPCSRLLA